MVRNRPWEVEAIGVDKGGVYITCFFDTQNYHGIIGHFGWFRDYTEYQLKGNRLTIRAWTRNTSRKYTLANIGWGFHPWGNAPVLPLAGEQRGERRQCRILIPATQVALINEKRIPTGELRDVREYAAGAFDFSTLRQIPDAEVDHYYTGIIPVEGKPFSRSVLIDPVNKVRVQYFADYPFYPWMVLYIPQGENVACIEHQTQEVNALNTRKGLMRIYSGARSAIGRIDISVDNDMSEIAGAVSSSLLSENTSLPLRKDGFLSRPHYLRGAITHLIFGKIGSIHSSLGENSSSPTLVKGMSAADAQVAIIPEAFEVLAPLAGNKASEQFMMAMLVIRAVARPYWEIYKNLSASERIDLFSTSDMQRWLAVARKYFGDDSRSAEAITYVFEGEGPGEKEYMVVFSEGIFALPAKYLLISIHEICGHVAEAEKPSCPGYSDEKDDEALANGVTLRLGLQILERREAIIAEVDALLATHRRNPESFDIEWLRQALAPQDFAMQLLKEFVMLKRNTDEFLEFPWAGLDDVLAVLLESPKLAESAGLTETVLRHQIADWYCRHVDGDVFTIGLINGAKVTLELGNGKMVRICWKA
jgi:galactose mutarotase-like enzyme